MIYLVTFVVLVLATARFTRLICKDDITTSMRLWIDRKFGEQSFLSRLIWCPWCVAVWVSPGMSLWPAQILYSMGAVPRDVAIMMWLLFIPANAYAAAWVIDKEGD